MVFSSLIFIYGFLPLCLLLYFTVRGIRAKNAVLLVFSLAFYAFGEPIFILIILVASLSAYLFALLVAKTRETRPKRAKLTIALSVAVNLAFLFVFKYAAFFITTLNAIPGMTLPVPEIALPIGISFYTFQILTYSIDVYRGNVPVQRNFAKLLLYVSLFPQLIAGPIVRYSDVNEQIAVRKTLPEDFANGATVFVCGLAKKVLLADHAAAIAEKLLKSPQMTTLGAWIGIIMFTFQIYFDFSGYSDMAVGLGRMFGFNFRRNFEYPYISRTVTEFWRRWHISLGTFFRDYVYIPLGGNRRFGLRNIAIVWLLTGLWHGAEWNFVLWGAYFGILLVIEKYILSKVKIYIPSIIKWAVCFFTVVIGWVLFYNVGFDALWNAVRVMFTQSSPTRSELTTVKQSVVFTALLLLASTPLATAAIRKLVDKIKTKSEDASTNLVAAMQTTYMAVLLAICTTMLVASSFSPFIYFRF